MPIDQLIQRIERVENLQWDVDSYLTALIERHDRQIADLNDEFSGRFEDFNSDYKKLNKASKNLKEASKRNEVDIQNLMQRLSSLKIKVDTMVDEIRELDGEEASVCSSQGENF